MVSYFNSRCGTLINSHEEGTFEQSNTAELAQQHNAKRIKPCISGQPLKIQSLPPRPSASHNPTTTSGNVILPKTAEGNTSKRFVPGPLHSVSCVNSHLLLPNTLWHFGARWQHRIRKFCVLWLTLEAIPEAGCESSFFFEVSSMDTCFTYGPHQHWAPHKGFPGCRARLWVQAPCSGGYCSSFLKCYQLEYQYLQVTNLGLCFSKFVGFCFTNMKGKSIKYSRYFIFIAG